jgi:tol-pal system protein YbgF
MNLVLAGCAANGTEEYQDGFEFRSQTDAVLDLRLSHLEDRLNAVETAVGALSDSPGPPGGRRVVPEASAIPAGNAPGTPPVPPRRAAGSEDQAAYDAALALYERHQPNAAQERFQAFLDQYPQSALVPNALYWLGESHYAAGRMDLAIMQFKKVAETYPRHTKAAAALLKAGYAYARLGDRENARFYWQILLDDFPDSAPAALARKRLAEP